MRLDPLDVEPKPPAVFDSSINEFKNVVNEQIQLRTVGDSEKS